MDTKRGRLVSFRLSEEEFAALHTVTAEMGTTISDFTRALLLGAVLGKKHLNENVSREVCELEGKFRSILLQVEQLAAERAASD